MFYRGKAVVPPNCPALTGTHCDLETAVPVVDLYTYPSDASRGVRTFVAFVSKDAATGGSTIVRSEAVDVEPGSRTEQQIQNLGASLDDGDTTTRTAVRQLICDRVANCPGLNVRTNTCGALGGAAAKGLIEAIVTLQDEVS